MTDYLTEELKLKPPGNITANKVYSLIKLMYSNDNSSSKTSDNFYTVHESAVIR